MYIKLSAYEKVVVVNLVPLWSATATEMLLSKIGSVAVVAQAQTICCVL